MEQEKIFHLSDYIVFKFLGTLKFKKKIQAKLMQKILLYMYFYK